VVLTAQHCSSKTWEKEKLFKIAQVIILFNVKYSSDKPFEFALCA
jgi:hypothetical protein